MADLVIVAMTLGYFAINVAFAWGCGLLMKEKN